MKSMQQIVDDMTKYFSEVNEEGIECADYCDFSYLANADDGSNSLYVVFFNGEERVNAWHISITTEERIDVT